MKPIRLLATTLVIAVAAHPGLAAEPPGQAERDYHSYANPEHVRVRHLALDLDVRFDRKEIRGAVVLTIERTSTDVKQPLLLDTNGLRIDSVEQSADGESFRKTAFELGKHDSVLGSQLAIQLGHPVQSVRIRYATGPGAAALQWLRPEQSAGKKHPYLFTQSQATDARSWIPLQDTPGVRVTYTARVRTPRELLAVMSAGNDPGHRLTGDFRFEMKQPIPSYLIALAVGDLGFRKLGPRTGVYAEPAVLAKAAAEFADIDEMMRAAEALYGPYRWDRYDVLVMPPSFPYGGMENPRLTFASPTVIAGDKSLVSLLAHELAHSWSGNLVSNATWRDFWLNEGFTVYLERRIMEAVYGKARAEAEAVLGRRSLDREMAGLPKPDQVLHIDLKGRPPVDGLTDVPYEKGALFIQYLEAVYGRETLDAFLKGYFDHFAFQSITTARFVEYLEGHLLRGDPQKAAQVKVAEWLYQPGFPMGAPNPRSPTLAKIEIAALDFASGKLQAAELPAKGWTAQEWQHFLTTLPSDLSRSWVKALDEAHGLTRARNSEVVFQWLLIAVRGGFDPAYPQLERFLTEQGRRKFLKPLYEELVKTPDGKARAMLIYRKARPTYHPISVSTVDGILGWKE